MKKQIIAGIAIIVCAALCAAVWPRSADVGSLPAESVINDTNAEFAARSEETPHIFISKGMSEPETEVVAENEPQITEETIEEKTETAPPTAIKSQAASKSAPASTEPKSGDRAVIDGKPHIWIPGFGWIVDEDGGSVGTMVGNPGDKLTGNKVGVMGGGSTVDGKGDINKQVGIMGGGSVAADMYENGNKIGIMGGEECLPTAPTPPSTEPELTGDVIYTELQPPVTKDSTPPAYKPNREPYNP